MIIKVKALGICGVMKMEDGKVMVQDEVSGSDFGMLFELTKDGIVGEGLVINKIEYDEFDNPISFDVEEVAK